MNVDKFQWNPATSKLMSLHDVHVWRVFLDLPNFETKSLLKILSADELERADQFQFERDEKRFMISRAFLRKILSLYLGISPKMIRFEYTSYGKPVLVSQPNEVTYCFNLSHSNEFALYAISLGRNIGIDIEHVRADVPIQEISERFYSHNEVIALNKINKNDRLNLFYKFWTRKEALLKAIGKGISFPMKQCDVSLVNSTDLSTVLVCCNNGERSSWYVQDLLPGHNYVAAIGVNRNDCNISCFYYSS